MRWNELPMEIQERVKELTIEEHDLEYYNSCVEGNLEIVCMFSFARTTEGREYWWEWQKATTQNSSLLIFN